MKDHIRTQQNELYYHPAHCKDYRKMRLQSAALLGAICLFEIVTTQYYPDSDSKHYTGVIRKKSNTFSEVGYELRVNPYS